VTHVEIVHLRRGNSVEAFGLEYLEDSFAVGWDGHRADLTRGCAGWHLAPTPEELGRTPSRPSPSPPDPPARSIARPSGSTQSLDQASSPRSVSQGFAKRFGEVHIPGALGLLDQIADQSRPAPAQDRHPLDLAQRKPVWQRGAALKRPEDPKRGHRP
jgi:hypothetical protein